MFSYFHNLKRLQILSDVSLIAGHPSPPTEGTAWKCLGLPYPGRVYFHQTGYTITIVQNRWLTWRRTFTKGAELPPEFRSTSRFVLEEWTPGVWPNPRLARRVGWGALGEVRCRSISWLKPQTDYREEWGASTRRQLRIFERSGLKVRRGNFEEVSGKYHLSQVPKDLQGIFLNEISAHLRAHPKLVEVLVAESATLGVVAGMINVYCPELKHSRYLVGFFLPEAAAYCPMVGLVDYWFKRTLEKGYIACDFGIICGPKFWPGNRMLGYSIFKTRFRPERIWIPKTWWRLGRDRNF
ncbi:MAG: hypothetical protein V1821_01640 [bacterium]